MGIKEGALALADELEAFEDGDCEECSLYGQPECKGHLSCMEIMARYAARKMREAVERDAEDVTTVSAYDLLSEEDRETIAWVREHGGLDVAASRFESGEIAADMLWGKGHGRFWTTDEFEEEISKRLMPADCEWPRFEDGEPVRVGDKLMTSDGAVRVEELSLTICDTDGGVTCVPFGERVKRPPVLADLIEPTCDRDALLAPAQEMVEAFRLGAFTGEGLDAKWCRELHDKYARRVREARGEWKEKK